MRSRSGTLELTTPRLSRRDSLDRNSILGLNLFAERQAAGNNKITDEEMASQIQYYEEEMHNDELEKDVKKNFEILLLERELKEINKQKKNQLKKLNNQFQWRQYTDIQNTNEQNEIHQQEQVIEFQVDNEINVLQNQYDYQQEQETYLIQTKNTIKLEICRYQQVVNELQDTFTLIEQTQKQLEKSKIKKQLTLQQAQSVYLRYSSYFEEEKMAQQYILKQKNETFQNLKQDLYQTIKNVDKAKNKIETKKNRLNETKERISELDKQLALKFELIQRCAEFLDELDDFDKLALIFYYDKPSQFDLYEINRVLQLQLSRPREKYQAQTFDEFVERLRFSPVSIRINLFFKFHKFNLNTVINSLILYYKQLSVEDVTLTDRYNDLLETRVNLKYHLNELQTYTFEYYTCDDHSHDPDLTYVCHQQTMQTKMFFRKTQSYDTLILRIYVSIIQSLSRFINTIVSIQEVLKTCQSYDFSPEFYMRSTYNPLFKNIKEMKIYLEDNFQITNICQSKHMRHSNLVLNTIFDKIENGLVKISKSEKKISSLNFHFQNFFKIQKEIQSFFPNSSLRYINPLVKEIFADKILSTFCSKINTAKLFENFTGIKDLQNSYNRISEFIQTEGKYYALNIITQQIKQLFKLNSLFITDALYNYDSDELIISKLTQKYNFREVILFEYYLNNQIIDKNSELYKFETMDWKKNTMDRQIKSLENLTGIKRKDSDSDYQKQEDNKQINTEQKEVFKEQPKDMELKFMHKKIQILKKDLYQINLQQRKEIHNLISEDRIPIFNHLNGQHRKNEKITANMKLNMNNIASTLKIEELDTPVRNSFRSSRMSRKKMESKTESPMISQNELPKLELNKKKKLPNKKTLQKLVEVEDFKSKYFLKLSNQRQCGTQWPSQPILTLKTEQEASQKQSTNNSTKQLIQSVYGKEQMQKSILQLKKPYHNHLFRKKNVSEELIKLLDQSIEQKKEPMNKRYIHLI